MCVQGGYSSCPTLPGERSEPGFFAPQARKNWGGMHFQRFFFFVIWPGTAAAAIVHAAGDVLHAPASACLILMLLLNFAYPFHAFLTAFLVGMLASFNFVTVAVVICILLSAHVHTFSLLLLLVWLFWKTWNI